MAFLKIGHALIRVIDTAIDQIGSKLLLWGSLAIMVVITIEVFSRRVFGQPTLWAYDLIIILMAMYVLLICAYGFQKGSFVFVDVISNRFTPLVAHIVTLLCFAVFFIPFVGGILPGSWRFFIRAVQTKEVGMSAWAPVQWPTKFALFFGMLMLLIQGVSEILKQVLWFFEGRKEIQKAVS